MSDSRHITGNLICNVMPSVLRVGYFMYLCTVNVVCNTLCTTSLPLSAALLFHKQRAGSGSLPVAAGLCHSLDVDTLFATDVAWREDTHAPSLGEPRRRHVALYARRRDGK